MSAQVPSGSPVSKNLHPQCDFLGVFHPPPSKINRVIKDLENFKLTLKVEMFPAITQQKEQEDSDCVYLADARTEFMELSRKKSV